MKFGAAIWPFQWDPPYEASIKRIADLGFKAIELIAWNQGTMDDYYTPQRVRDLRRLLDGEGLELSQLVHSPKGLASTDASVRHSAVESFRRAVDLGADLGTTIMNSLGALPFDFVSPKITERPFMQTFSVPYPRRLDWSGNWEQYVDAVRECTRAAEAAGMRYSIEAHPFRWISGSASMLRLIEHVGSPSLGMNFDPSHLFPVGDIPHAVIYQLAGRIFHCHFSDNDGATNVHWRPGKGKIDWVAVIQALSDVGYDGVISIELEDVPGVARPVTAAVPNPTATAQFASETVAAVDYIRRVARSEGHDIEWGGDSSDAAFYA
jgi:sugar phosphate isomerase/epimerase